MMRIFAALLLLGLASEGWAESGISGMLACNPNDKDKKPVLYAFDGEYLIRDNELAYPFQFLASLPNKNEIYFAENNNGSFINNQRVRVSKKNNLEDCLFSADSEGLKFAFPELNMRNSGCAALDLAYVGSGRLDGYFHNNINLWDIAAGVLIVKEAGGIINDISKFSFDNINVRAASGDIYQKMMKKLDKF